MDRYGCLDIVVNNAGTLRLGPFVDADPDEWNSVVDTHLKGTAAMCRASWSLLKQSSSGRIVNTVSSAMVGASGMSDYAAAEGALFSFTKSLALEGDADGILVNAIMPIAQTRMTDGLTDPAIQEILKREFSPDRVAAFVVWLVHGSTDVTGEVFRIGARQAARVILASTEGVSVQAATPEAWALAWPELQEAKSLAALATTFSSSRQNLEKHAGGSFATNENKQASLDASKARSRN